MNIHSMLLNTLVARAVNRERIIYSVQEGTVLLDMKQSEDNIAKGYVDTFHVTISTMNVYALHEAYRAFLTDISTCKDVNEARVLLSDEVLKHLGVYHYLDSSLIPSICVSEHLNPADTKGAVCVLVGDIRAQLNAMADYAFSLMADAEDDNIDLCDFDDDDGDNDGLE